MEGQRQSGNSSQSSSSSGNPLRGGLPLDQGLDDVPQQQNAHWNGVASTQLSLPIRSWAIESGSITPTSNQQPQVPARGSLIPLPLPGAEVGVIFPPMQFNIVSFQQPPTLAHKENAQPRNGPEYMHVQGQLMAHPEAIIREQASKVVAPIIKDCPVDVCLSLNVSNSKAQDEQWSRSAHLGPVLLSSGYSSYTLEDNELGEGTSSEFRRVSCKRRGMEGVTAPSGWLTLGQSSRATTLHPQAVALGTNSDELVATLDPCPGLSRNIRQRSSQSGMEHQQPIQGSLVANFSTLLQAIAHNSNSYLPNTPIPPLLVQQFRSVSGIPMVDPGLNQRPDIISHYELPPTSNMTNLNYFSSGITTLGGDLASSSMSAGTNSSTIFSSSFPKFNVEFNFQGPSSSDLVCNGPMSPIQFQQGNHGDQFGPKTPNMFNVRSHQNQGPLNHNLFLPPGSACTTPRAASRQPEGPRRDRNVAWTSFQTPMPRRSSSVTIREVGSSSSSAGSGRGRGNPRASFNSIIVAPIQQTSGRLVSEVHVSAGLARRGGGSRSEDVMVIGHSMLYDLPEETSDDEDAYDDDEYEDLRFDVDGMSYEELLELEEEMGEVSTGLSADAIEERMTKTTYGSAESPPKNIEPCCICQEEYVDGDELGKLDCGHDFHFQCVKQWLERKNTCPICKNTALVDD